MQRISRFPFINPLKSNWKVNKLGDSQTMSHTDDSGPHSEATPNAAASCRRPLKPPQADQWCLVKGSSWEAAKKNKENSSEKQFDSSETLEPNGDVISSAFRQIKYELYCASVDLLGYSLEILPNRNCLAQSSYAFGDDSEENMKFEFVYDHSAHKYTDLIWTDQLQQYAELYQYWILERQCIPGFLAEILLDTYNLRGAPPCRPRN